MSDSLQKKHIQQLLASGQAAQARALCQQWLNEQPENLFCLSVLAHQAFFDGQLDTAETYLRQALDLRPDAPALHQNLGMIYQRRGHHALAAAEFLTALAAVPETTTASELVLRLAAALEPLDTALAVRLVSWLFDHNPALISAWQARQLPPNLQSLMVEAHSLVARQRFDSQWQAAQAAVGSGDRDLGRLRLFLRYFHGLEPIRWGHPEQRPSYHFFPGLRAQPFYDLDAAWVDVLRAAHAAITAEKNALLQTSDEQLLKPYVDEETPDDPAWKKLERNLTWTSAHILKGGQVNEAVAERCPDTLAVLEQLPLARMTDHAPEAFFSILRPGTYIPPHFGLSNLKLTVHLGLDIPTDCAIRVGGEQRGWQAGEVLIFDDSFRHEAWNRSRHDRAVLITEVWHPDLTETERQGLGAIMDEQAGYNRQLGAESWPALADAIRHALKQE